MFSWIGEQIGVKSLGELMAPTQSLEEQLHTAIEQGAMEKVKRLLDEDKVSPMAQSASGNTPLHTAAYHDNQDVVLLLLQMGVDVAVPGRRGSTALHFAASQGHEAMVRLLVDNGANAACKDKGGKTAYDATEHTKIRQFLLPLQFQRESKADKAAALTSLPPGVEVDGDEREVKPLPPPPPTGPAVMYGAAATAHDRPIQADGFGTSVGNAELSAKYGNTDTAHTTHGAPAAPPSMPNATSGAAAAAASVYTPGASNPYLARGRYGASLRLVCCPPTRRHPPPPPPPPCVPSLPAPLRPHYNSRMHGNVSQRGNLLFANSGLQRC